MARIIFDDKYIVSQHILGKPNKISPTLYARIVPEHVTKDGAIVDAELKAGSSLETIAKWADENLDPGAPCGGGGFEILDGSVYDDDTEGGCEFGYKLTPLPNGLELEILYSQDGIPAEGKTLLEWPVKASQVMAATLPDFAQELIYQTKPIESPTIKPRPPKKPVAGPEM